MSNLAQLFNDRETLDVLSLSPNATAVYSGSQIIIQHANDAMITLWGKDRSIIGLPIETAVPELASLNLITILKDVWRTGKTYQAKDMPTVSLSDGQFQTLYFDFTCRAVKNKDGEMHCILHTAVDVTEQVNARKELEHAQDTLRLAIRAAELGTFDLDLKKGTMDWDDRCRTLFGISHKNTVTYDNDFVPGLHPEDRDRIIDIINKVYIKAISNGNYDVEYRTVGVEDQKLRWVRAKGKTYFDEHDVPQRFIGAVLDITEQKQNELRKNDFIGMVSHELKTPLTSLNAYIQMLYAKAQQNQDTFTAGALDKAILQVKKMTSMINGFLNVSRLESGKIHLHKQLFDLPALLREIVDEATMTIASHQIEMPDTAPLTVNADRDKIGSVVSNLLSNAAKYSPKGKTIQVLCETEDNQVRVSVKDEGMGIKPEDAEKLFERYYRVNNKHTQTISGFGIGLYLSAEILQHHNGSIWVESEPGKGSTFYFSLPLD